MILETKPKGQAICKDLKFCESFKDRMFGLIISQNPRNLLFETRFGIHTFFLKEPIDIVILDSNFKMNPRSKDRGFFSNTLKNRGVCLKIVKIKKDLKPNQLFFWNPLYSRVLELKAGTIARFKLKENNLVVIK